MVLNSPPSEGLGEARRIGNSFKLGVYQLEWCVLVERLSLCNDGTREGQRWMAAPESRSLA